jgi:uncharacterized protein (DUF2141 family)
MRLKTPVSTLSTLAGASLLVLCAEVSAEAHRLEVTVDGFRNSGGFIMLGLFDNEAGYDSEEERFAGVKAPVAGDSETVVFEDVPAGTYAIKMYHDENESGEIDSNFMGIPTEPYGFSNNPGGIGVPSFEAAAFTVEGDTSISITLR